MVGFRKSVLDILGTVPVTDRNALLDGRLRAIAPTPPLPDGELPGFVGRRAATDYSVAMPFGYRPEAAAPGASVAVVCHIYHIGLAGEIRQYLDNIPFPADLFVSTDTEVKRAQIARHFADWSKGDVTTRITPNRGRDIAPKLVGFHEVHERYEYVLHLHSKQSWHDRRLAPWRGFLFENLLGSPAVVCSVFEAFARDPQLGMIAPQHYEYVRRWLDWGGNYAAARTVAARMGIRISPKRALDFPSGSMFWARTAALKPLLDLHLAAEDFPDETGQVDGTPAHAIERLYYLICEKAGYRWLKIARPELYLDTSTIVPIDSPMAFDRFVADHGVVLSGPHPLEVAAELPDITSDVPPGLLAALASRREELTQAAE